MPASPETYIWSNASGGDWTVPTNWSQSSYPNASTATAIVGLTGFYTVSLSGTDPAITVGTLSITDTSADLSISTTETDTVSGALNNAGRIDIDDQFGGAGGSTLNVGGTLTNSGQLNIGEGSLAAPVLVTAAALTNTGVVNVSGDTTNGATLAIAGAAGFGTAGTVSGTVNLSISTISFGSGTITTIANGAQLQLWGASQITDAGGTFNSALATLATNAGELSIEDQTLAVTGNFDNSGRIDFDDQFGGAGGSTLEITNGGTATLNANDTNLTVQLDATTNLALGKIGFVTVNGGTTNGDTITGSGTNETVTVGGGANQITMSGALAKITTGNGNNTITANGSGDQITTGSGNDTITDMVGSATIRAGLGTNTIQFAGSGNELINQGGTDTLTDSGSYNTFVVPLAGQGLDTINGSVLTNGDTFDLRAALAATTWDQQMSDIGSYLTIATQGSNALVQISDTAGGTPATVSILNGAGSVTLSTFLPHALLT